MQIQWPKQSKVATFWWLLKFGFKVSPLFYTLRIITETWYIVGPIVEAFFAAKILGELIFILNQGGSVQNSNLILFISIAGINLVLMRVNNELDSYFTIRYNLLITESIFELYLKKMGELDMAYHEDADFKTRMQRVDDSLGYRLQSGTYIVKDAIAETIGIITNIGILASINPIFIILILAPNLINLLVNRHFGLDMYTIWDSSGEQKKQAAHSLQAFGDDSVIAESKIYGFGNYIVQKYKDTVTEFRNAQIRSASHKYVLLVTTSVLYSIVVLITQIWIINQVLASAVSIAGYTFYLENIFLLNKQFSNFQISTSGLLESLLYVGEIKAFAELPKLIKQIPNAKKLGSAVPEIEFKDVSFHYPHSKDLVLNGVSFKLAPGQKVALVGQNGSGKSTLIKLLARFYDPTSGEILINGTNLKDIDIESYYKLWGILFQNFAQYWFTLRENIGLGNIEDIQNVELVKAAAEKAGVDAILPKLAHGYETMLSTDFQDGKNLSGGEWQKVGIARGLFASPKLIVLDEPTSALDALAEAEVFEQIRQISRDTSMLMVSHRFSTVRQADHILVLENGAISEQGNHTELMNHHGLYSRMFNSQAEGYK